MATFRFGRNEAVKQTAAFPAAASSAFSRKMREIEDQRHGQALESISKRRPHVQAEHGAREARNLTEQFAQSRRHRDHERQIENAFIAERLCKINRRRPILCDPEILRVPEETLKRSQNSAVFERLSKSAPSGAENGDALVESNKQQTKVNKTPWRPSSASTSASSSEMGKNKRSKQPASSATRQNKSLSQDNMSARNKRVLRRQNGSVNKPVQSLEQARRIREKRIQLENQYIGQRLLHARPHYSSSTFAKHEAKHTESLYRFSANPRMGNSLAHSPNTSTIQFRKNMQKIIDATWIAVGTPAPGSETAPPGFRKVQISPRRVKSQNHVGGFSGFSDSLDSRVLLDEAISAGDNAIARMRAELPQERFRIRNVISYEEGIDEDLDDTTCQVKHLSQSDVQDSPKFLSRKHVASIYDVDPNITVSEIRQRQREQFQKSSARKSEDPKEISSPERKTPRQQPRILKPIDIDDVLNLNRVEGFTPRRYSRPETYRKGAEDHKKSKAHEDIRDSNTAGIRDLWIGPQQDEIPSSSRKQMGQSQMLPRFDPLDVEHGSETTSNLYADGAPLRFPLAKSNSKQSSNTIYNAPAFKRVVQ